MKNTITNWLIYEIEWNVKAKFHWMSKVPLFEIKQPAISIVKGVVEIVQIDDINVLENKAKLLKSRKDISWAKKFNYLAEDVPSICILFDPKLRSVNPFQGGDT